MRSLKAIALTLSSTLILGWAASQSMLFDPVVRYGAALPTRALRRKIRTSAPNAPYICPAHHTSVGVRS
ncbi:MAG: hypothetical protein F6J98_48500 [Moorea sp. SIO4G2]|uniref:hypothetical protein n=1 Tax=unclassified Moorena TaxID=2683338 RepID=UPI0013F71CFD|nr:MULTISPECIES: hypothetical protein [unclassified Moorena]NEO12528.1 hypothetical protein [Moorena sp. SIO3E8]NEO67777.1 hypothetical protein [Moorena sp. SIO4G2]NEQ01323.1 hypothetical protein [Moorena sp. SIO3F7]